MANPLFSIDDIEALWAEWLDHDDGLYWDRDHHREKVTLDGQVLPFPAWLRERIKERREEAGS